MTEVFTIYSESDRGSTNVSNLFIDEYMKDANDAQIKIYLYLLRMVSTGSATSISGMADRFNHTEKDVVRSLRYWEKKGLLSLDLDSKDDLVGIRLLEPRHAEDSTRMSERVISITPMLAAYAAASAPADSSLFADASFAPAAPAVSAAQTAAGKTSARGRDRSEEALEAFRSDRKRAELLFIIEQYIGKPLAVNEIRTVCYISEDLHFSDELIDYLFQYCVDRGKKDFRYIEKVAVNWSEKGITTPLQAQSAQTKGRKTAGTPAANQFNRFQQNRYDFGELEKDILDN
ncbi:MAG: DnaD domain protein [Lachnospiraceae bacterium]|jgi:DnaD/phage-associated family protein|nr:DnaD domain protein [Lachnospiraceae bacterium]